MRIQHNIMAMNAYRNYTNNVSAMKANLEKLSSGYKINRAGDDAAGLAISEKMRAQITGLQTAQKNAKDGISLVQTAEGALTEVHDMLNRMVELATQSANGTYDNETDRAQLQKELNQLSSEIDRIADSSNFNGIKLLDGSMEISAGTTGNTSTATKVIDGMDRIITSVIGEGEKAYEVAGNKTVLDVNLGAATKAQFSIDLTTMKFENADTYKIKGTEQITVTVASITTSGGVETRSSVSQTITIGTAVKGNYQVGDSFQVKATVNNEKVTLEVTIGSGGELLTRKLDGSDMFVKASNSVSLTKASKTVVKDVITINVNGTKISTGKGGMTIASADNKNSAALAAAIASAVVGANSVVVINGVKWKCSTDGLGKLNFTQIKKPQSAEEARADFDVSISIQGGSGKDDFGISLDGGSTKANADGTFSMEASIKAGTVVSVPGIYEGADNKANTIFNIKADDIQDGTKIAIGTRVLTLAVGPNSKVKDTVNTQAAPNTSGWVEIDENDSLDTALGKISEALGSTVNFLILDKDGNEQKVQFQIGVSDSSQGFPAGLAVQRVNTVASDGAANTALKDLAFDSLEKLAANFKMRRNVTNNTTGTAAKNGLTLQIGDTPDEFNKLRVSISDMHAEALGISKLDISSQEGASAAIDKIKAAINMVSDVRGTLGATQNRLDHTINNLSVMTENIQDAESTIRDTDVADEMMAYTKNNILIQSAQAMLAQANQVPQGVLQLLQ